MPLRPARDGATFLLCVGGAIVGCVADQRATPWRHVDLSFATHRLETLDGHPIDGRAERVITPLGPSDLRQLLPPAPRHEEDPSLAVSSGRAMALAQPPNTRLLFDLTLGEEAFLEFRPAIAEAAPDPLTLRVIVRNGGGERVVWQRKVESLSWPPPELEYIPLERTSNQGIALVLETVAPAASEGRALWFSARVVFREAGLGAAPATKPLQRPNVLLIGADTLRADALGVYGRSPSLTPAIDALATESDLWLAAFSTFNVTVPSFASIMTGLYGKQHGVYENQERLREEAVTLAEVLGASGYATGAFLSARHLYSAGVAQGFQEIHAPQGHQAGELATNLAMNWIATATEPFLAWVHLYDPHTPHTPPGRYGEGYRPRTPTGLRPPTEWEAFRDPGPRLFEDATVMGHRDLYAGEVAVLDRQVDRLVDFLRSRDGLADTIIVLVGDHGENLGENGIEFRHSGLWDSVVHVPLMIRWAGHPRRGRRFTELVQTIDLFPTLIGELGIVPPPNAGESLPKLVAEGGRRAVFAEQDNRRGEMVRTQATKYFRSRFTWVFPKGEYLYDLSRDPFEKTNLVDAEVALRGRLAEAADEWTERIETVPEAEVVDLSAAELEELRSLGYVD